VTNGPNVEDSLEYLLFHKKKMKHIKLIAYFTTSLHLLEMDGGRGG